MKKSDKKGKKLLALAFPALGFLLGLGIGMLAVKLAGELPLSTFLLMIVWIYVAAIIQVVIHESGHLVFGLASGYKFSSFRIGPIMLIKSDAKLTVKRLSLAGTAGQCLMSPPEVETPEELPTALYNLGGSIMNLIAAGVFGLLALVFRASAVAATVLAIAALVGLVFALLNGIPFESGLVVNDGFNERTLRRKPSAKRALAIQLKVADRMSRGERLSELPEEWFELPEDISDPINAAVACFRESRLADERKFAEAKELCEHLWNGENGLLPIHKALIGCELLTFELLGERNPDKIASLTTKKLTKQRKSLAANPSVIRTEYLLAKHNGDEKSASKLASQFERLARSYPYPQELPLELELMRTSASTP